MIPDLLAPEQITVTSGADPLVEITLRNGALCFPEFDDLTNPNVVHDNRVAPGIPGRNPLPGIEDELRATLPFWLTGTWSLEDDEATRAPGRAYAGTGGT
jgi:hypothetical protein